MKKTTTLLVIIKDGRVLLGMKKRGFGQGRWNGFGGKPDGGESVEDAAVRETQEECRVIPKNIVKMGVLDFEFAHRSEWNQQVHFFATDSFEGEPVETEEMKPQWFLPSEIPLDQMWPDDKFWIPMMLEGKKFEGRFMFGENDVILEHEIREGDTVIG